MKKAINFSFNASGSPVHDEYEQKTLSLAELNAELRKARNLAKAEAAKFGQPPPINSGINPLPSPSGYSPPKHPPLPRPTHLKYPEQKVQKNLTPEQIMANTLAKAKANEEGTQELNSRVQAAIGGELTTTDSSSIEMDAQQVMDIFQKEIDRLEEKESIKPTTQFSKDLKEVIQKHRKYKKSKEEFVQKIQLPHVFPRLKEFQQAMAEYGFRLSGDMDDCSLTLETEKVKLTFPYDPLGLKILVEAPFPVDFVAVQQKEKDGSTTFLIKYEEFLGNDYEIVNVFSAFIIDFANLFLEYAEKEGSENNP